MLIEACGSASCMSQDAVCDPWDGSARRSPSAVSCSSSSLGFSSRVCFQVDAPAALPQCASRIASTLSSHQQPFLEPLEDRAVILSPPGKVALREFLEILRQRRQQLGPLRLDEIVSLEVARTIGHDTRISRLTLRIHAAAPELARVLQLSGPGYH